MTSPTWSPTEPELGARAEPVRSGSAKRARTAVVAVGLVALVLALLHGAEQRPWAYEDEQQHVDVALKLADGRVAHIADLLEPSVARSTVDTSRPSRYRDPSNVDPSTWGLEGRSYMGYHPPLAPALLAPVAAVTGRDAYLTMRAGRIVAALLVALTTMLVAVMAARWCPERRAVAATMAGLAFGTLPVVSDLGGRWSNDVVALALTIAACAVAGLVADAAHEPGRPSTRELVLLGGLLAGAVSAKATGWAAVAVALAVAGPAIARSRGWRPLAAVVAAPVVAVAAWVAVTQVRYGTPDGSAAFREVYGSFYPDSSLLSSPFDPDGGARLLVHRGLLPLLNVEWGLSDWVPFAILALFAAGIVAVGRERRAQPLVAFAAVALPTLLLLDFVMRQGQNIPSGRFLAPVLAVGAAVAARTWSRWAPAGWIPPALCGCVGAWFLVEQRLPW